MDDRRLAPDVVPHASPPEPRKRHVLPRSTPGVSSFPIVVHSHLRWSFVWQRPQQTHTRLARSHQILILEEPVPQPPGERPCIHVDEPWPNVYVAQPMLEDAIRQSGEGTEKAIRRLLADWLEGPLGRLFTGAAHWLYTPLMEFQIDSFRRPGAIVYDCMDELSSFAFAPPELQERETRLLSRADLVLTGGYELYLAKRERHSNIHSFGCGVDFEHFSRASRRGPVPADLETLPGPRFGSVGVLVERLEYDLLETIALANRRASLVLIGPILKVDPDTLPRRPNIHYLGARRYQDLPDYLRGIDVCLMPFAMNEASRFINPTKTLEYLATGKPVVSTPVPEVVRSFSKEVHIADRSQFAERIREVAGSSRLDPSIGLERARGSSWEEVVDRMESLVERAIRRRQSPKGISVDERRPGAPRWPA